MSSFAKKIKGDYFRREKKLSSSCGVSNFVLLPHLQTMMVMVLAAAMGGAPSAGVSVNTSFGRPDSRVRSRRRDVSSPLQFLKHCRRIAPVTQGGAHVGLRLVSSDAHESLRFAAGSVAGPLRGERSVPEDGGIAIPELCDQFLGIPYAQPPAGRNRFEPPVCGSV